MKAFVSKPVQILAKQFDGTRESAKEITDWIKKDPNSRYNSAELREQVSKFGFDSLTPHAADDAKELTIHTDSTRIYVKQGNWVVLFVDTGQYCAYHDSRLRENYAEL